jgi:hypothetical protein
VRTALDIDDDILQAAKKLARRDRKTAGRILSELARRALTEAKDPSSDEPTAKETFSAFVPLLAGVGLLRTL